MTLVLHPVRCCLEQLLNDSHVLGIWKNSPGQVLFSCLFSAIYKPMFLPWHAVTLEMSMISYIWKWWLQIKRNQSAKQTEPFVLETDEWDVNRACRIWFVVGIFPDLGRQELRIRSPGLFLTQSWAWGIGQACHTDLWSARLFRGRKGSETNTSDTWYFPLEMKHSWAFWDLISYMNHHFVSYILLFSSPPP